MNTYAIIFLVFNLILNPFKIAISENIVSPSPDISALQVVEIQLFALQSNDIKTDLGIKQTWEFAHPRNKQATGPYNRFQSMIRSPAYILLLNNNDFETKEIKNDGFTAEIAVKIDAKNNKSYAYLWRLEKITEEADLKDVWMTVGVSNPIELSSGL